MLRNTLVVIRAFFGGLFEGLRAPVVLIAFAVLAACESSPTELMVDEEQIVTLKRVTVEASGLNVSPLLATQRTFDRVPTPVEFLKPFQVYQDGKLVHQWPIDRNHADRPTWFGSWLGLGGMKGEEDITITFRAAFINGLTARPITIKMGVMVGITTALGSWEFVTNEFREAERIGANAYQVIVPLVRELDYNVLNAVVGGVVDECTAAGTKRLLVDDIRYQSSDGWTGVWDGTFLFTFECGPDLPTYVNVPSAAVVPTITPSLELPFATREGTRTVMIR